MVLLSWPGAFSVHQPRSHYVIWLHPDRLVLSSRRSIVSEVYGHGSTGGHRSRYNDIGILVDGANIGRVTLTASVLSARHVCHRLRVRQPIWIELTSMDDP